MELIANLKTKLSQTGNMNKNDALDDCMMAIYGDSDELENIELELYDNYTNILNMETDTTIPSNNNKVRSICDSVNKTYVGIFLRSTEKR